jgi:membrane protein DedA with SNARE-associated domain
MSLEQYPKDLAEFVHTHKAWAAPIVFMLVFGESLAFISLFVPAWSALIAIGALMEANGIDFVPFGLLPLRGAAIGDWLSYRIGATFKTAIAGVWPLSRRPDLIPRGQAFVKRRSVPGVFVSRFFGPRRAAVPLVAGIFVMPFGLFRLAPPHCCGRPCCSNSATSGPHFRSGCGMR